MKKLVNWPKCTSSNLQMEERAYYSKKTNHQHIHIHTCTNRISMISGKGICLYFGSITSKKMLRGEKKNKMKKKSCSHQWTSHISKSASNITCNTTCLFSYVLYKHAGCWENMRKSSTSQADRLISVIIYILYIYLYLFVCMYIQYIVDKDW